MPTSRQEIPSTHLRPKRSPKTPLARLTNTPARLVIPHTVPIWTRLILRSLAICGKSTGMQEKGMAETKVLVAAASPRRYHR